MVNFHYLAYTFAVAGLANAQDYGVAAKGKQTGKEPIATSKWLEGVARLTELPYVQDGVNGFTPNSNSPSRDDFGSGPPTQSFDYTADTAATYPTKYRRAPHKGESQGKGLLAGGFSSNAGAGADAVPSSSPSITYSGSGPVITAEPNERRASPYGDRWAVEDTNESGRPAFPNGPYSGSVSGVDCQTGKHPSGKTVRPRFFDGQL